jgi:hypothetical protein
VVKLKQPHISHLGLRQKHILIIFPCFKKETRILTVPPPICHSSAVKDFVIVPLHTTPETSVKEIDELVDVYTDVRSQWKTEVRLLVLVCFHQATPSY